MSVEIEPRQDITYKTRKSETHISQNHVQDLHQELVMFTENIIV